MKSVANFLTQLYLGNTAHKTYHVLLPTKNLADTILKSGAILRYQNCAVIVTRMH